MHLRWSVQFNFFVHAALFPTLWPERYTLDSQVTLYVRPRSRLSTRTRKRLRGLNAATMIGNFVWNADRPTTGRYACTGRFRSIRACIIEEAQFSAHRHVQSVAKGNRALPDCRGWPNLKVEEKRCMFDNNYGLLKIFNDNFVKFFRDYFSSKILYKQTKKRRRNVYIALLYIEN